MPEQLEAKAAGAAHDVSKGIGSLVKWVLIIVLGLGGFAAPQAFLDSKALALKVLQKLGIDKWKGDWKDTSIAAMLAGAVEASLGGMAFAWGYSKDKIIGAAAQLFGAYLLGRGVRLVYSGFMD